jgi:hypothetical protein
MTGVVLALAGLTCGDGGPGAGAATAPVALASLEEQSRTSRLGIQVAVCRLTRERGVVRMSYAFEWTSEVSGFIFLRHFGTLTLSYWDAQGKQVECNPDSSARHVAYLVDGGFASMRRRRFEGQGAFTPPPGAKRFAFELTGSGAITKPVPLPPE